MKFASIILLLLFPISLIASAEKGEQPGKSTVMGCSYIRSLSGAEKALAYYNVKVAGEADGTKQFKMFVSVEELSSLTGNTHEMLRINEASCTDILSLRQDGDKVYCTSEDGKQEWLIMDYGLNVGEAFVGADGERYVVAEVTSIDSPKRRKLELTTQDGKYTDTWIEGMGSFRWGFLPGCVAKTLRYFRDAVEPLQTSQWAAADDTPADFIEQAIDDDCFKLVPFVETADDATDDMTFEDLPNPMLTCSFVGNDLWVRGYYPLNLYRSFMAAVVDDACINLSIHQLTALDDVKGQHIARVDVRIPGFHDGTYVIRLAGQEDQTATCRTANGTPSFSSDNDKPRNNTAYDLEGRKVGARATMPGIYVKSGKKIAIK